MELIHILLIFSTDFLSVMPVTGKPNPPTDIRIDVIDNKANLSWIIPTDQGVQWSRIYLYDSKSRQISLTNRIYKDLRFPECSFMITSPNIQMCSKYSVSIQYFSGQHNSDISTHIFWMTNNVFTADINQNVTLSWTTSIKDVFSVYRPFKSTVIYEVQFGSIIENSKMKNYTFDRNTMDVNAINITVIRIQKTDAGLYRAAKDETVDGCCLLIVTSIPINTQITLQPPHPFVGNNVTLTCLSTIQRWPEGYGTSHLSYQFHGNKRGPIDNNKLQIHKLTMSDKGTIIKCQATDDLGKVSTMSNTVTLDPYYGPDDVKQEPPNTVINVTEGSTLGPIRCHANCNPKCKYQWKQNATGSFENVEHVSNDNQNLNVSNIKRGQAATFRCSVNHQYSNHKGRTDISVNVQYSPEIVAIRLIDKFGIAGHGNPTTYNFNEDVNIMTTLRINSNPESKLFLRSYLKIYQLNHTKVATDYKSKLISLKCEDSGNFEIQARNGIPYGDNKTVNFIISCKPRNVTTRSSKIGTKVNTRKNIELQVVSFPEPTVQWLRSTGFDWTVKKDIYDYKYKISSTIHVGSEKDFGEYRLKICNSLGCIGERITLTPEDKPEAPQNVSLKTTSFRSVNLSWIAGFNGGDHQTFSVQFKTLYDEKWETRVVHTNITRKGSMVYYTLDQLKPDTSYQVIVLSTNKHGKRNASLQFQTKVEPTLSSCASSNSASISHLTVGLGCGIPPLLVVIILLVYIYRRNQDNTSDLKEKKVKSEQSDEYTVIQRSNPTFTEAYSTLHSPTELTALQANSMETDTYDECGVLADVEVNQTMDNSKRGASIDKQESGQEQTKEGMYDNMKI